jgi:hypothetical protein
MGGSKADASNCQTHSELPLPYCPLVSFYLFTVFPSPGNESNLYYLRLLDMMCSLTHLCVMLLNSSEISIYGMILIFILFP